MMQDPPKDAEPAVSSVPTEITAREHRSGCGADTAFQAMVRKRQLNANIEDETPESGENSPPSGG